MEETDFFIKAHLQKKKIINAAEGMLTDSNLVMVTAAAIFLPYILSGILLVAAAIFITINKQTREVWLLHKGIKGILAFQLFFQAVSFFYGNWMGVLGGFVFTLAAILGIYQYQVMTAELYEKSLKLMCIFSCFSTLYALVEQVMITENYIHYERVCSIFFYPNYFATISATVVLICAYKLLTGQGDKKIYWITLFMNLINIYLSQSMFGWVEVLAGISVMLLVLKYYRLLYTFTGAAAVGIGLILLVNPDIIPRISEANITLGMRFQIWRDAITFIKEAPLFGKGSMTYAFATLHLGRLVVHSHSIFLESLLNYGILGSIVLVAVLGRFLLNMVRKCFYQRNTGIAPLILGVAGAALVHGLTDVTLMWLQTLPLFLFILAGAGALQKNEEEKVFYSPIPGFVIQKVTPVIVYCKVSYDNSKNRFLYKESAKNRISA